MGLIKCQDCGKMISDLSEQCFNCGKPLQTKGKNDYRQQEVSLFENEPRKPFVFGLMGVVLVVLIWSLLSSTENAGSISKTRDTEQYTDNNEVTGKLNTTQYKWYEGGNLHQRTLNEWAQATSQNKLATCADFAAAHPNIKKILEKSDSMETLLPYAMQLVTGIDEVVKEKKIGSQKVSETAAILMVLLKW